MGSTLYIVYFIIIVKEKDLPQRETDNLLYYHGFQIHSLIWFYSKSTKGLIYSLIYFLLAWWYWLQWGFFNSIFFQRWTKWNWKFLSPGENITPPPFKSKKRIKCEPQLVYSCTLYSYKVATALKKEYFRFGFFYFSITRSKKHSTWRNNKVNDQQADSCSHTKQQPRCGKQAIHQFSLK